MIVLPYTKLIHNTKNNKIARHMPARETPSRNQHILISQPNNRTCHSKIYPKPEGSPT